MELKNEKDVSFSKAISSNTSSNSDSLVFDVLRFSGGSSRKCYSGCNGKTSTFSSEVILQQTRLRCS